jgi:hypothetical protein
MSSSPIRPLDVHARFRKSGLSLTAPGASAICNVLQGVSDPLTQLPPLIAHIKSLRPSGTQIPLELIEASISLLTQSASDAASSSLSLVTPFDTTSSLSLAGTASLRYDPSLRTYALERAAGGSHQRVPQVAEVARSRVPSVASSRPKMFRDRYHLALARVQEGDLFRHTPFKPAAARLSPLGSLLGVKPSAAADPARGKRYFILGMLVRTDDSVDPPPLLPSGLRDPSYSFSIHDPASTLPLLLPQSLLTVTSIPLTAVVLIEATLRPSPAAFSSPSLLHVLNISLPPHVPRPDLLATIPPQVRGLLFPPPPPEPEEKDQMLLLLK